MHTLEERLRHAHTASGEDLWKLIRDPHPQVLLNATLNRNLSGEMALSIAKKRNIPAEALGFLAADIRFMDNLKLKSAICSNPRTPQRVAFSLLKHLRIFDLADLTRDQAISITVRQKIESLVVEKIPSLPSGMKMALSRRASIRIIISLLEYGDAQVINACLDSALITETNLCAFITTPAAGPAVIRAVAGHRKWSLRYLVKYALIRNQHTPMVHVARLVSDMRTSDLRELFAYENLSVSARPHIFSELGRRGEKSPSSGEEIFEVNDEGLQDISGDVE